MPIFATTKTVPLAKDLAVANAKPQSLGTAARQDLESVLDTIDLKILTNSNTASNAVSNEQSARIASDDAINIRIDNEITNRTNADSAITAAYQLADNNEITARGLADTRLQNEIDGERAPLRMSLTGTDKIVSVAAATLKKRVDSAGNSNITLGVPNGSLLSDFGGATVNFSTGVITYTDGTASGSFSPQSFAGQASKFTKYALVLLPTTPNTILVLASGTFATTALLAAAPAFSGGVAIGIVAVQDNGTAGTGTIANTLEANLTQFLASGSGSGGSGAASPLDPEADETFIYYTRSDFSVDAKSLFGSTTGSESILGLKKITLGIGQNFISKDLIGTLAATDALEVRTAQARILYNTGFVDATPTVQFSKDGTNYVTATTIRIGGAGNMLVSDVAFTSDDKAFESLYTGATVQTAIRVASIATLARKVRCSGFTQKLSSASVSGTVVGKIYEVVTGTPTTVIATSIQTYVLGQDITTTAKDIRFDIASVVLDPDKTYAFVAEASAGTISSQGATSTSGTNVTLTGSSTFASGWTASATKVGVAIFGGAYELYLKITSSTALSELAGFGVEYIDSIRQDYSGYQSYEERYITSTEASTGLITLSNAKYTVGARQLQCNTQGHTFMAPDFVELSPSQVQFTSGFFTTGDFVRFYTGFGVIDGTSQALSKIGSLYSAIVGSSTQVAGGVATHSSITTALAAVASGGVVKILAGTYTENITISSNVFIEGQGYGTILNGTVSISSSYSTIKSVKAAGNISLSGSGNYIRDSFIGSGLTITDTGSGNAIQIIQE